ncbi:MAG: lysophospholipid acyltransferase family protein [Syntrophobacter sp.]
MRQIRSAFFYTILALSTIILGTSAVLGAFVSRKWPNIMARTWGKVNLWAAGVKVEIRGRDNLEPNSPYILTSNHQGWFDIFAALGYFPVPFSWLAKEELFKVPFLGRAMYSAGYIPIDRSDRRKALISMGKAAEIIRQGTSVFIFPEGTRSIDGSVRDFKKGGFVLAAKSQQPIVPISISGSYDILPKNSWMIHPGLIRMTIDKPVMAQGSDGKSRDLLMQTVRDTILRNMATEDAGQPCESRPQSTQPIDEHGGGFTRNA